MIILLEAEAKTNKGIQIVKYQLMSFLMVMSIGRAIPVQFEA